MFIKRAADGAISAVSAEALEGFVEIDDADKIELIQFCQQAGPLQEELAHTDLTFIRVLEDVIELLVQKNLITFTDLPAPAQDKILARQNLRHAHSQHLDLLESEGDLEGLI